MRALFATGTACCCIERMERLIEYSGNHPYLVVAAVVAALIVLGYELYARRQSFAAISSQDAIRLMNQGALVLDIRKPEEFSAGHLAGARHMDSGQILQAGETLKKHKEKLVVVYSEDGSLGASAARQLAEQGFTKAYNLRGGVASWRSENLPLTKS